MPHIAAGSTAPPRWTWSSVSSSPRGCGRLLGALLSAGRRAAHAAPAGVAALAAIGAVELVADGAEDVDEDVRRGGGAHVADVTRALRRSDSPRPNPWRSRRAPRS